MPGRVYLVGAGPGDPELLTLRAARLISQAQSLVYDRLVSDEILSFANPDARLIPVGKKPQHHPVPQDEINSILVAEARKGRRVVRLKGGDPYIFGRGFEELIALSAAGIRCDVVPGITAAQGCAASAGVPLTHRGLATSVRYITGHCRDDLPLAFDWQGLSNKQTTLVVYMGASSIGEVASKLIANGLCQTTPALAIAGGTTANEQRFVTHLGGIREAVVAMNFHGPVLFIIGDVVSLYAGGDENREYVAAIGAKAPPVGSVLEMLADA
ncbi:MAG: uroporphyrinogen-III C-methyltransferase [Hyphomicrobiaceae bacterium]|nr:uroporphyrinogen-III C-methyltransferase [Hyphomicrobiaceae bacterium]MCC0010789.1 uroporphyrinogen-III C-methyltransferase [Hyphomicrobiaceae bacterium]